MVDVMIFMMNSRVKQAKVSALKKTFCNQDTEKLKDRLNPLVNSV